MAAMFVFIHPLSSILEPEKLSSKLCFFEIEFNKQKSSKKSNFFSNMGL